MKDGPQWFLGSTSVSIVLGCASLPASPDEVAAAQRAEKVEEFRCQFQLGTPREAAWAAYEAGSQRLHELHAEIAALVARAGRELAAAPTGTSLDEVPEALRCWLFAGWAALDAALLLELELDPDVLESWWDGRWEARPAALLLASLAPPRFAEALAARADFNWEKAEWPLWCDCVARSGGANTAASLLRRVAVDIDVVVHLDATPEDSGGGSIGCGRVDVPVPEEFPPPFVWRLRGSRDAADVQIPERFARWGARRACTTVRPMGATRRDGRARARFNFSTAYHRFDRAPALVEAVGGDFAGLRGAAKRHLDFTDADSHLVAIAAMERADAQRWEALLAGWVASGRLAEAAAATMTSPFRYRTKVVGSAKTLEDLGRRR